MRSGQRPGNEAVYCPVSAQSLSSTKDEIWAGNEAIYCLHGRMNGVLVNSWGRRERRKKWRGGGGGRLKREGD